MVTVYCFCSLYKPRYSSYSYIYGYFWTARAQKNSILSLIKQ
jgi:hypothetical protein